MGSTGPARWLQQGTKKPARGKRQEKQGQGSSQKKRAVLEERAAKKALKEAKAETWNARGIPEGKKHEYPVQTMKTCCWTIHGTLDAQRMLSQLLRSEKESQEGRGRIRGQKPIKVKEGLGLAQHPARAKTWGLHSCPTNVWLRVVRSLFPMFAQEFNGKKDKESAQQVPPRLKSILRRCEKSFLIRLPRR